MKVVRSVLAVILGYVLFAVAAVILFKASGQDPHRPAPLWFMVLSTVYGAAFAFLGARVAGRVAGYNRFAHALALAAVIAAGAFVSLVSTLGHGAVWTQVTALLFMAPSALIAGRRNRHQPAAL